MTDQDSKKQALVDAITTLLKANKVVQRMFADFGAEVDSFDDMPVDFADLKVSAKTKNGKVYLNEKLLDDNDFKDDIHYLVHEGAHWLQQTRGDMREYAANDSDEYLDLPAEIEAFRYQIQFIDDFQGSDRAEQYVEDLLDFHELEGEERAAKKEELMGV